jgi:hypothetical protein
MLGYARRAAPIGTASGSADEGGTSTYVKQGGDTPERSTSAGDRATTHSDDQGSDGIATGTVNTNTSEPPANATNNGVDPAAPTRIARTQSGASVTDAIQSGPPIALSAALPPLPRPRPFLLFHRPIPAVRAAVGVPSVMRDLAADPAVNASERALANRAPASTSR